MEAATVQRAGPWRPGRPGAGVLAAQLRGVPLFSALPEATLAELADAGVPRVLHRRASLFRKGDACRGLHVVLEGRVEIYASAPDGREQVLHRIGARQAVTELPLFDGATYPASARAATHVRVLFIPAPTVDRLFDTHPELLRSVIRDLGRSIRRLTRLVEKVSLKDVRARVATALLEQASGAGAAEGDAFRMAGTQEQMANALGVTRESVARALAKLRRTDLIAQDGREVRILDVAQLAAIADGHPQATATRGGAPKSDRLGAFVALDGPCC